MARSKAGALDALKKVREEREKLDVREAQLRGEAAGELGQLLIACGAEHFEPKQLKALIRQSVELGIDTALARLAPAK